MANIYKQMLLQQPGVKKIKLPYKNLYEAKNNILSVSAQYGEVPTVWYMDYGTDTNEFLLVCLPTGVDVYDDGSITKENYIGTVLVSDGFLVLHYFLVEASEKENSIQ